MNELRACAAIGIVFSVGAVAQVGGSAWAEEAPPRVVSEESAEAPELSPAAQEVLRLAESGVGDEVILAYIENAPSLFDLQAGDIVYLHDLGISGDIAVAMLRRDAVLREQGLPSGATTNQFIYDQKLYAPATNAQSAAPPPIYVTNAPTEVTYFYDSLAPYGTWIELEGYGWCWRPSIMVIEPTWRPYWQGGQWIYTDLGWYWRSDYSWGWAPFHYGRWHHHPRHGWVWFPDLMWAPAWVSWRYSDAYCGWAPLPPGARFVIGQGWRFHNVGVGIDFDFHLGFDLFTFVEIGHLHDRHPRLHGVPPARLREIHSRTTVINNYVVGENNRIINRGIAVNRVAAASGRPIRPVAVRDAPAAPAGGIRRDRMTRTGAEAVIYRPELKAPAKRGAVVAQKVDERHPIVRPARPQPAITAPRRLPESIARPVPSASTPPARTPPKRIETRPVAPPLTRPAPKASPSQPSQTVAPRPASPTRVAPRVSPPKAPVARPPDSVPSKIESPKGREQRVSNGDPMRRPTSVPASPPAGQSRPTKQRNRGAR